jgi:O-acetyl-ADP-ribose deacetylase (regulator of RNase III)
MGTIKVVKGDVTNPKLHSIKEIAVIPHCCNNIGVMGAGVAKAIRDKWPIVYKHYKQSSLELGSVSYSTIAINDDIKIVIANMIGQDGVCGWHNSKPLKYWALAKAMLSVAKFCKALSTDCEDKKAVIHCPKFGSDLAGGNWDFILELIKEIWLEDGIDVVVYEFEVNSNTNKIKDSYDFGLCPDCNTEIPDEVLDGESCSNCGHVFYEVDPDNLFPDN